MILKKKEIIISCIIINRLYSKNHFYEYYRAFFLSKTYKDILKNVRLLLENFKKYFENYISN